MTVNDGIAAFLLYAIALLQLIYHSTSLITVLFTFFSLCLITAGDIIFGGVKVENRQM